MQAGRGRQGISSQQLVTSEYGGTVNNDVAHIEGRALSTIRVSQDTLKILETYIFLESVKTEIPSHGRRTHNVEDDLHVPWKKVLHKRN